MSTTTSLQKPENWRGRLLAFVAFPFIAVACALLFAAVAVAAWFAIPFMHKIPPSKEEAE